MGLYHALFGAKPPYGTPPFAPPHLDTGGAMTPPQPGQPQRGLAGFFDRFAYPANALGQIGQALLAGGGGGLGNAAQLLMAQGESRQRGRMPSLEHVGDTIGVVDPTTGQFTPTYTAPDKPKAPHYWESNDGSLHEIGDDGKPVEVYHDPTPKMNFIPDGMGGGSWVAVPTLPSGTSPTAPVGSLTPIDESAPSGAATDYGAFKKAIIGQETGGRYGIPNAQGSGAMGVGQVMPGTAKVLAGRLGLPYQPRLMGGTDLPSRSYQDQITEAAVRDAWQAGGGDPALAAMHYFGGSDRGKWGPKTRQYATDILSRIGG